jgi:hypothetical protein
MNTTWILDCKHIIFRSDIRIPYRPCDYLYFAILAFLGSTKGFVKFTVNWLLSKFLLIAPFKLELLNAKHSDFNILINYIIHIVQLIYNKLY